MSPAKQMVVEALGKHTATVIFSHGLGDTAAGWYPFAQSLQRQFTHVKWILPTAPTVPVTLNMGMSMPSWFDIKSLDPPLPTSGSATSREEDEKGMLVSVKRISDLITQEIDSGIQPGRIVVGGFSQGITSERKLAGLASLSGFLGLSQKVHQMQTEHAHKLPIFWGHGTDDQVVRYAWGQASVEKLKSIGFKSIEFHSYPGMAHSLCAQEQEDFVVWLKKVLPDA